MDKTDLLFFGDWWDDLWRRRQQIAYRLSQRPSIGKVIYVEQPLTVVSRAKHLLGRADADARTRWPRFREKGPIFQVRDNLWVMTPVTLSPWTASSLWNRGERALRGWLLARQLRRSMHRLGMERPVVWASLPHTPIQVLKGIPRQLLWYDCTEDFSAYAWEPKACRAMWRSHDDALLAMCDVLSVVTLEQHEAKRKVSPHTYRIPNGVDWEMFQEDRRETPPELASLPRPRIGFVGGVNGYQDWTLVKEVCQAHPEWPVVLIGPVSLPQDTLRDLQAIPSVHILGPRPYNSLPGYLQAMDACIQLYRQGHLPGNEATQKTFLYMAAGKPIVTFAPGESQGWDGAVRVAHTHDDFLRHLEEALVSDSPELQEKRRSMARGHSWEARVEEISALLTQHLELAAPSRRANA